MTRTALYRHYDADGRLLYVGISIHLLTRTSTHMASSYWKDDICRIDVEWFDSPQKAARAELLAIKDEKPLYNSNRTKRLNPIQEIIDTWPNRTEFAQAIGCNLQAVHKWAQSGRVPSKYQARFVEAANDAGLSHVTADWMLSHHAHDAERAA